MREFPAIRQTTSRPACIFILNFQRQIPTEVRLQGKILFFIQAKYVESAPIFAYHGDCRSVWQQLRYSTANQADPAKGLQSYFRSLEYVCTNYRPGTP